MSPKSLRLDPRRRMADGLHTGVTVGGMVVVVGILLVVVLDIATDSLPALSLSFLTEPPGRTAADAGIGPALAGTAWLVGSVAVLAIPLAIGAALWLEEYAPDRWSSRLIAANVDHLAHVPSVVYGVLGLTLFVRGIAVGRSLIAGVLTLTIFVLPILILSTQEALRAVPDEVRDAARSVGASRWQVVWHRVLPAALPNVVSGALLALARVVGETAPLVLVGTLGFVAFAPSGPTDALSALPLQIFDWVRRPQPEFQALAAAAIVVLFVLIGVLQLLAALARFSGRREARWL